MSRKIDFDGDDWSAHNQSHWLDFAADPNVPDVLRVVFVAYGRHRANGHARLRQCELAHLLVRRDGTLPDRRNVKRAIDRAIARGYLAPQSRVLCLVVSSLHVQGGIGDPDRPCDRDHTSRRGKRTSPSDDVSSKRTSLEQVVSPKRTSPSDDVSCLVPLSSIPDSQSPKESAS